MDIPEIIAETGTAREEGETPLPTRGATSQDMFGEEGERASRQDMFEEEGQRAPRQDGFRDQGGRALLPVMTGQNTFANNKIADLKPLQTLEGLEELNLSNNPGLTKAEIDRYLKAMPYLTFQRTIKLIHNAK